MTMFNKTMLLGAAVLLGAAAGSQAQAQTARPNAMNEASATMHTMMASATTAIRGAAHNVSASAHQAYASATTGMGVSATTASTATKTQKTFLNSAIEASLAEINAGQLALEKGSSTEVKAFAQQMIDDHSMARDEATRLAQGLGLTPPASPSLTQQAKGKGLSALSGQAFDRMYVSMMVRDHKTTVGLFQDESARASDGAVRDYAKATLPKLKMHLDHARKLEAGMKGKK